ncbi:hypothetical protein ACXDF8_08890 [Mycolicibacterium sp. CBM1]
MSVVDTDVATEKDPSATDDAADSQEAAETESTPVKKPRQIAISLRGLIIGAAMVLLITATAVLGWLYVDAEGQLDANAREAANRDRAETVAIDYAVNAADMNYQDFAGWKTKLVNGTSPELKDKLAKAADSMEQVLAPLQWKSTARPLAAKVRSSAGGIYTVDAFVSVLTKTMQAPEGLQSTATYNVTIDSRNGWQITDVGGVDAALGR